MLTKSSTAGIGGCAGHASLRAEVRASCACFVGMCTDLVEYATHCAVLKQDCTHSWLQTRWKGSPSGWGCFVCAVIKRLLLNSSAVPSTHSETRSRVCPDPNQAD